MGDPADGDKEPTLELPKLFGRRTSKGQRAATKPTAAEAAEPVAEPETQVPPPPAPEPQPAPPPPAPDPQPAPPPTAVPSPASAPAPMPQPTAPAPRRARRERRRPRLPGTLAALLTGLLVGAVGCALTYGALLGCEALRGTSTCGEPGFFLLVAIFALMVLLGAGMLAVLKVASAGSTSFLAVGLVVVLVMVALLDVVFSAWMFLVVPVLAAASYALSHWVTTRFAEEAADPAVFEDEPGPDVR